MNTEQPIEVQSEALVVKPENAQHLMRYATDVAGVCKEIVLKSACNIQGKKYIKCEGWMSIATAHGCIASSRDVKRVDGGWTAIGEIRRMSDGAVLSTAEGFVGKDEKRWGSADEYACRAMAQTRAISRACRAAFAHIVVLMDAGLQTTPFEEVPDGGFDKSPPPTQKPPKTDSGANAGQYNGDWRNERVTFGKNSGRQLGELTDKQLAWYIEKADVDKDTPLRRALDVAARAVAETVPPESQDEPFRPYASR